MDAIEAIKNRHSSRRFVKKPLAEKDIETLADCGRLAATARNAQPWEFVVLTRAELLEKLSVICPNGPFLKDCGAAFLVLAKSDERYYLEDCSAATQNILLAATALGLGSCWVAGDKKDYASAVLALAGVPAGYKLVSIVGVGVAEEADRAPKRPLAEVLHREKF
ncbi:MAG: nitroreductase family protein [Elusimicrobiaceae bacterium]|jgi:nitroreductase